MVQRCYDVIVFGATGDTGSACARLIYHFADKFKISKWTMACRNLNKLQEKVIKPLINAAPNGCKWSGEPIQADSDNLDSLVEMCKQTKVVIACAGPYAYYGEKVIAACIKAKTNYVDVTGETDWVNDMRKFYGKSAREAGVSIVSFCGYDSVPSDISAWMLANSLCEANPNDPPAVIETYIASESAGGGAIPNGTIRTLLRMVNNIRYKYSFGLLGVAPVNADAKVKELHTTATIDNNSDSHVQDILKRTKRDIQNNNSKFISQILLGDKAIKNSTHQMGRINIGIVHETGVNLGFDDFQYYERQISGGRRAWELHENGDDKNNKSGGGIESAIGYGTMLQAIPMAFTPWFDDWVMAKVKEINSAGSDDNDSLNLIQRLMNEGKNTGYTNMTGYAISKSKKLLAKSTLETNYEPGIGFTMTCACAVANVLANQMDSSLPSNNSGFNTPVIACGGEKLKEALINAGVNISCEVNPTDSKL